MIYLVLSMWLCAGACAGGISFYEPGKPPFGPVASWAMYLFILWFLFKTATAL